MITIKKIEVGYGIFDGDRLVDFAERKQDYAGLVNTVITVNTKYLMVFIDAAIETLEERIKKDSSSALAEITILRTLKSDRHFLESYNA